MYWWNLICELGFYYVGPIDGHDVENLVQVIKSSKHQGILIRKDSRKGYKPAEDSGDKYHGVSKFNVSTGEQSKSKSNYPTYTKVFAETLIKHTNRTQNHWNYWSYAFELVLIYLKKIS